MATANLTVTVRMRGTRVARAFFWLALALPVLPARARVAIANVGCWFLRYRVEAGPRRSRRWQRAPISARQEEV